MFFSLLFAFVSFFALPCCCLAGQTLLDNAASSSSPSATNIHTSFGRRHSSVPMPNNGIVPMRKLSSSNSLKVSATRDNERKVAFLTKPIKNLTDETQSNVSPKMDVFHDQNGAEKHQMDQTDNYVPFPRYWHAILDHFNGKVPAKTIANILCHLITAFKLYKGNHDYDVITSQIDFDGILTAEHFLALKKIGGPIFQETELRGNICFIVKKIVVPTNAQLPYMSPAQVIHKSYNYSTEQDIVWSLGVMLFTMLTNHHPLQPMADEYFKLAQQNANDDNKQTVDIGTLLAESSEDMVPKWHNMITVYVQSEKELPFEYVKSPISVADDDHDLLIPVVERCLQMKNEHRISLCRLRKTLEEIVEEIENVV
ncbi:hypothetical protein niasHT_003572 [Heterodera trifolii]|uniref:Protein kinase domain-containing protein n=1 Tax=Heterodera trifolii TaxID=157864 RepID=A0ABD2M5X5_9BILA